MTSRDTGPKPADILAALGLLSRLPLPDHAPRGAAAAWAWPVAGAILGGIAAAVGGTALLLGVPPATAAAFALAAQALLTGALHEDGLADTFDGFWGGRDRARRLEIMKDSRIGSYGVLALVFVTLIAWSALAQLAAQGMMLPALVAAGALSRVPMAAIQRTLPNARGRGLSHTVGRPQGTTVALAAGGALLIALFSTGWAAIGMAAAVAVAGLAVSALSRAKIGGQTGDTLGAAQQLAFAAALVALAA